MCMANFRKIYSILQQVKTFWEQRKLQIQYPFSRAAALPLQLQYYVYFRTGPPFASGPSGPQIGFTAFTFIP